MAEQAGEFVGNWQLARPIGNGGMGVVYRATHRYLEREAAVKVLHPHLASDPMFRARFLQEARAVSRLDHPRVLSLLDFGADDDQHYLVMPLLPDGTLRTLLRQRDAAGGRSGPWSLALGLELVRQAAEGLAYAHAADMVHRDIKPDNLLLRAVDPNDDPADDQPWPWSLCVGDFGLARLADSSHLTASGITMGTPAYMSPEQCQGLPVDGRCDVYALGVVLYEIVTGAVPFPARTLSEAVYQHVFTPPAPPRLSQPDLPQPLEALILRCLAKSPDERFPDMQALEAALRAVQTSLPTPTRPSTAASAATTEQERRTDIAPDLRPLPLPVGKTPPVPLAPLASVAHDATPARDTTGAPRVVVTAADGQVVAAAALTGDGLRVGRLSSNALVLPQQGVSRNHAQIDWDGEQATVTDLGSSNGTALGGVRLTPHQPQPWPAATPLRIGPLRIELLVPEPASVAPVTPAPRVAAAMPRPPDAPTSATSATPDALAEAPSAATPVPAPVSRDARAETGSVTAREQAEQAEVAQQASAAFVARRSAIEAALPNMSAPAPQPLVPTPRVAEVATPPFKREPRAFALRLPLLLLLLTLLVAAGVFGVMYLADLGFMAS